MDRFDWIEIDKGAVAEPEAGLQLKVRPYDGASYYRAARQMREAAHFRPAVDFYRKAVGFQPHHYTGWVELVDTLLRARQRDSADEVSQQALDAFRQVRVLYASRALVLGYRGEYREARRHLEVSLDCEDPPWYAKCVEAELLIRQDSNNRPRALACLEDAADWADSGWDAHFIGGWMLLDAGFPALAAGYFAEAAHWNAAAPVGWLCLGDCFRELRLYEQALFYYQRVTELEPAHDLALKRQKACSPKLFGLLRVFNRNRLRKRWNERFERIEK